MKSRLPARPFVTVGLVLLVCASGLTGRAAAQVQYSTVALSGQAAPGTPAGVSYIGFDRPTLNDAGQVAYLAFLTGSGVRFPDDHAIYAGGFAAPLLVARTGNVAPGTAAGVRYSVLVDAFALNDVGQVAYFARLTGAGVTNTNNTAIYAGDFAAPQLVAREGSAAPGTPAGVNYSDLETPALNDVGQAAYGANLTGAGVTTANDEAIYVGAFAAPQLVARKGSAAPGTPAGVNYSFLGAPVLNEVGQAAYGATLTGAGVTGENNGAIYAGAPAAPQLVARKGSAAPGTPAGVNYSAFFTPALNDAGQVAYFARLTGAGLTIANDSAIYAGAPGAPQLVAREGSAAPGTPAGVNYSFLTAPALNDAGQVAYFAALTGASVTTANDGAIYAGAFAAPQLVARKGSAAPGTPAGVNYSNLHTPALNDAGQVAYVAALTGAGVTTANDQGLFAFDPLLGQVLIAREGNLFDVGGGDLRTIADLGIGFSARLSSDGTLAFSLVFTDDTSGVFTAFIPVPEPSGLSLLAAGLTLAGCRSPRGRRLL